MSTSEALDSRSMGVPRYMTVILFADAYFLAKEAIRGMIHHTFAFNPSPAATVSGSDPSPSARGNSVATVLYAIIVVQHR